MRRRSRDVLVALALAFAGAASAQSPDEKPSGGFLGMRQTRSKEPITITADNLVYEYKDGVIVYRGDVLAVQGDVKVRSNELRITLVKSDEDGKGSGAKAASDLDDTSASKIKEVVASGNVRIDQGASWAVGGKATFDQSSRTLVLTENPVLHQGPNEIAGDRVIVYLDKDMSVIEGGHKRVKANLFPGSDEKKPATAPERKADARGPAQ